MAEKYRNNTTQPNFCPTQHQNFFMKKQPDSSTERELESEEEISEKVIIILQIYQAYTQSTRAVRSSTLQNYLNYYGMRTDSTKQLYRKNICSAFYEIETNNEHTEEDTWAEEISDWTLRRFSY